MDKRLVPKPAGPAIFIGIAFPLIFLFFYTSEVKYFAVLLSVFIVFLIGVIDDFKILSGNIKTGLTVLGALPILIFGVYEPHLLFPILGPTRLTIVYPLIVLLAIPIIVNAVNMIDVYNGTISGTTFVLSFSQLVPILLYGKQGDIIFPLLLMSSSFAFYLFNRYPSRIFAGDSGSLLLGSLFGVTAIVSRVEIPSLIAFVPAILNGFYILASIKKFIEHRSIKERPVQLNKNGLLVASKQKEAPMTLARLIIADGPMSEKEAASKIILLFVYSVSLAILTSFLIR
ncbi:MAG: hypothetical protein QXJ17_03015 [Nitrososphaeria archaeon]